MTGQDHIDPSLSFGQTIRKLRRAQRLTQRELAEAVQALGLKADFTYISKIENDRLDIPPSEPLIRGFAQILEVDAEALLQLAGKFDQRALQEVVAEIPEAGILLRRLQARKISQAQLQRFLDETD
jgi:transcriptional regulator with XRE-family HTH domain